MKEEEEEGKKEEMLLFHVWSSEIIYQIMLLWGEKKGVVISCVLKFLFHWFFFFWFIQICKRTGVSKMKKDERKRVVRDFSWYRLFRDFCIFIYLPNPQKHDAWSTSLNVCFFHALKHFHIWRLQRSSINNICSFD